MWSPLEGCVRVRTCVAAAKMLDTTALRTFVCCHRCVNTWEHWQRETRLSQTVVRADCAIAAAARPTERGKEKTSQNKGSV